MGYASTCNSVGVPVGMFIGSICFTLLVSKSFSDKYLWTRPGTGELVTMKSTDFVTTESTEGGETDVRIGPIICAWDWWRERVETDLQNFFAPKKSMKRTSSP